MACLETLTYSDEETVSCGRKLGECLLPGDIVCFFGDLAAGKTTFIKGLVAGAAGDYWDQKVVSPTFTYLNMYEGSKTIYHFDLYRLKGVDEFLAMGFDDFFTAKGICCIEWAEKLLTLLPTPCIRVTMKHEGITCRRIIIT
ncbi:MAG TPA: tRNA (adenosine(37)-N6)-threonylcarbamoyltransferase complex ATPase subunit type 1 TsaE [Waddliaceae bacterium]